jgi:hypothetical protein
MENQNQVEAQAMLIRANPIQPISLGDTVIDWHSTMGSPTDEDGEFAGNAYYSNANIGVVLTEAVNAEAGSVSWDRAYDYTRDIHITAALRSGEGSGADGFIFFFGSSGSVMVPGVGNGGISVVLDEYNDDVIRIYNDNSLIGTYNAYQALDNNSYRRWEIIYKYKTESSRILSVLMDGVLICKLDLGSWTPGGECIGVSGWTGGSNNVHVVRSFSAKSAQPWLAING